MIEGLIEVEDHSEEWWALGAGSIGGSLISDAVSEGNGKVRNDLMDQIIEELWTGRRKIKPLPYRIKYLGSFEEDARAYYILMTGKDVKKMGIVKRWPYRHYSDDGYSPGRLLEIKSVEFSTFRKFRDNPVIPTDHRRQMQWGMLHFDVGVCDYLVYCHVVEPFESRGIIVEVKRDEKEITELSVGCDLFVKEMLDVKQSFERRNGGSMAFR